MDQAIKAALDKFHGKQPKAVAQNSEKSGAAATVAIVLAAVIIGFSICARFGYFGADILWNNIKSSPICTTVAAKFSTFVSKGEETQSTEPVNTTGESGTVTASDTLSKSISADFLRQVNNKLVAVLPVKGVISCEYGNRVHPITGKQSFHSGIDIASPEGESVVSYKCGEVIEAAQDKTYGNYVRIRHDDCETFYGHLSKITVKSGEVVAAGTEIGKVGSTGVSTGPHLHFEMKISDKTVNPVPIVYAKI